MATLLLDAREVTPVPSVQTSSRGADRSEFLRRTVPKPFPSAAEREMEEELEGLAREEVNLWDGEDGAGEGSRAAPVFPHRDPLPSPPTAVNPSTTDASTQNVSLPFMWPNISRFDPSQFNRTLHGPFLKPQTTTHHKIFYPP